MMRKLLISGLLAGCMLHFGCGKKASEAISEKLAEKILEKSLSQDGADADIDLKDGKLTIVSTDREGNKSNIRVSDDDVTIVGQDGKTSFVSGKNAKLPDAFPKDVLVYAGATLTGVWTLPEGFNLTMESPDSADAISKKYQAEMKRQGWEETGLYKVEKQTMLAYKKDDRTANLMINADQEPTAITLTVMKGE